MTTKPTGYAHGLRAIPGRCKYELVESFARYRRRALLRVVNRYSPDERSVRASRKGQYEPDLPEPSIA